MEFERLLEQIGKEPIFETAPTARRKVPPGYRAPAAHSLDEQQADIPTPSQPVRHCRNLFVFYNIFAVNMALQYK